MRIGFVSTYPPIECGIATYTRDLNEALRRARNETFVMSQFGAQGEQVFPVYQPESTSFASDLFYTSVRMTPDVMHIQHEYGLFGPQRGVEVVELLLRYRLAGVPVVTTIHTVYDEVSEEERLILKYLVDESSAVIVHEEFQRETLGRYFDIGKKVHVIEHGVRRVPPIVDAKQKLDLVGKKVVMLCGYFRASKGFHKIIDILPELCKRDEDLVLVMAGKARGIDAFEYQRELYEKLNNSPLLDRIVFLRGQFPQHTFDTILSAADVVVLPYEKGAQSGMMCQCFALGRPVVVSPLRAFRNLVERSGGGLVCEEDSKYTDAILRVLNEPGLAGDLRNNIAQYVETISNWDAIAQRHIDVYHSVVTTPYGKGRYVYFPEPDTTQAA